MTISRTGEATGPAGYLYPLLAWMSPAFPIGAYTYSHGLEWAVEEGTVRDAGTLEAWLRDVLHHGAGRTDAILLARGQAAAHAGDTATFRDLLDLSLALQPSSERRLETTAQGDAFIAAVAAAWPPAGDGPPQRLFADLTAGPQAIPRGDWSYPLALALAAAAWQMPPGPVVTACLQAFTANLISAAVRAVPLGQTAGQTVQQRLAPAVAALADLALTAPVEEIGGCAFAADIASMRHETQYTRLFRS
ncbi:urease accessory protein UreF [Stappia indica]|uniref:urease accessory protein UreF n=1 Tax=Stappia indica TaxID=538381 RepID=UPI001CD71CFD|nr:urease accessory UreF family protein [Stappia indica]MCA1299789.1 urease accessory protein UreF [Stappia indica]